MPKIGLVEFQGPRSWVWWRAGTISHEKDFCDLFINAFELFKELGFEMFQKLKLSKSVHEVKLITSGYNSFTELVNFL